MEEELSQNSATSISPQPITAMVEQELSHISTARLSPQPITVEIVDRESQDSAILFTAAPPQYENATEFPHTVSLEISQPSEAAEEQSPSQNNELTRVT